MRNQLGRKLLATERMTAEYAAWEFLVAVRELFPDWFKELHAITLEDFDVRDEDEPWFTDFCGPVYDELYLRVQAWLEGKGLSCSAVDAMATELTPDHLCSQLLGRDGRIRSKDSFGPDPNPPRDTEH